LIGEFVEERGNDVEASLAEEKDRAGTSVCAGGEVGV